MKYIKRTRANNSKATPSQHAKEVAKANVHIVFDGINRSICGLYYFDNDIMKEIDVNETAPMCARCQRGLENGTI